MHAFFSRLAFMFVIVLNIYVKDGQIFKYLPVLNKKKNLRKTSWVFLYVSVRTSMCMCASMCVYVCVYVCVCVYLCVCLCVCNVDNRFSWKIWLCWVAILKKRILLYRIETLKELLFQFKNHSFFLSTTPQRVKSHII